MYLLPSKWTFEKVVIIVPILTFFYVVMACAVITSPIAWYHAGRYGTANANTVSAGIVPALLYMFLTGMSLHPDVPRVWDALLVAIVFIYWVLYFVLGRRHAKKQAQAITNAT